MSGFNAQRYGRLVYALRHYRGFENARDLAAEMEKLGVPTSERTMWAIERGDQEASVSRHLAICRILRTADGYFNEALEDE